MEYLHAFLSVFVPFAAAGLICAGLVALHDWLEARWHRRQSRRR